MPYIGFVPNTALGITTTAQIQNQTKQKGQERELKEPCHVKPTIDGGGGENNAAAVVVGDGGNKKDVQQADKDKKGEGKKGDVVMQQQETGDGGCVSVDYGYSGDEQEHT